MLAVALLVEVGIIIHSSRFSVSVIPDDDESFPTMLDDTKFKLSTAGISVTSG
jgi:hypothetical protein